MFEGNFKVFVSHFSLHIDKNSFDLDEALLPIQPNYEKGL